MLRALDQWMSRHPWHPRILPLIVYVALLLPINLLRDISLWTYPVLYVLQCGVVCGLLWRYRRLLPEVTLRFHWSAVPVGVLVTVGWVALGLGSIAVFPDWLGPDLRWIDGEVVGQQHYFVQMQETSTGLYWTSLILRLLGMSLVVPLFEELFNRSLLLRSFYRPRRTALGALQLVADMPVIGEWFEQTRLGQTVIHRDVAAGGEGVFAREFEATPLGALSVFAVTVSTLVFMFNHMPRDFAACIMCGIAYCLLVGWTNGWGRQSAETSPANGADPSATPNRHRGLGPVIWAHGITNALLWAYCMYYGDWQFM